jgi:hypothetical protein
MKEITGTFKATLANIVNKEVFLEDRGHHIIEYDTQNYITDVEYNLCPNDKIICEFTTLKGDYYTFDITYFSNANFEHYYALLYKSFGNETDLFGTITERFDGFTSSIIKTRSTENVINALVYALKEIFICIKQIVETHKEKTLVYCFLQPEDPYKAFTYEEYIHSVACCLIIKSGYYRDTITHLLKEDSIKFAQSPRDFCDFLLEN